MKMRLDARWGAVILILAGSLVAMKFNPQVLPLNPDIKGNFVSFFTQLAAIALFVKRALEVLVTPWREKDARKRQLQTKLAQKALETHLDQKKAAVQTNEVGGALDAKTPTLLAQMQDAGQQEIDYRTDTQRIAFVGSLAVGIAVSLVGFRALGFFANKSDLLALSKDHHYQFLLFQAMDILLSGAVISGGADGIHQIVTVFTSFADNTKNKMKEG